MDGWVINFWDAESVNPFEAAQFFSTPFCWFDIRDARTADCEYVHDAFNPCRFEVKIGMRFGIFSFRVAREHEALDWVHCVRKGMIESSHIKVAQFQRSAEIARSLAQRDTDDFSTAEHTLVSQKILAKAPERKAKLKGLWAKCVRGAASGAVNYEVFGDIYTLYDNNADHCLSVEELELCLRELLEMRLEKYLKTNALLMSAQSHGVGALAENRDMDVTSKLGQRLRLMYMEQLARNGFTDRVILVKSKLDMSRDGRLSQKEFMHHAPEVLLPLQELALEARFYTKAFQFMDSDGGDDDD